MCYINNACLDEKKESILLKFLVFSEYVLRIVFTLFAHILLFVFYLPLFSSLVSTIIPVT